MVVVLDIIYLFVIKESYTISRVFIFTLSVLAVLTTWSLRTVYKKYLQSRKGVGGDRALIIFTDSSRVEEVVSKSLPLRRNVGRPGCDDRAALLADSCLQQTDQQAKPQQLQQRVSL